MNNINTQSNQSNNNNNALEVVGAVRQLVDGTSLDAMPAPLDRLTRAAYQRQVRSLPPAVVHAIAADAARRGGSIGAVPVDLTAYDEYERVAALLALVLPVLTRVSDEALTRAYKGVVTARKLKRTLGILATSEQDHQLAQQLDELTPVKRKRVRAKKPTQPGKVGPQS